MGRTGTIIFISVALCAAVFVEPGRAQKNGHSERKVVDKIAPVYPDLAKRMHITGVVKVEVAVRANGSVKSTKVLGGNPVLIESATDAVRKWKFEAATAESTEVLQLTFDPH
jgi:TonB family protein